ncbi:YrhK-like protein [Cohaesibacter sp. ES.047]|uniref:YrhK family protein n=1 Tax=Cohaesibacter sp. ES.047 TaxID=1798205 RepID=UPI000BB95CF2|nr:YrhK family protein [Cohaesibacter sp. ES.047]SNY93845.1 YrhK-like protein [Cohaesibacter sp. ES.047]
MKIFQHDAPNRSRQHTQIYAVYELAYSLVDLGAALLFIIGSVMFFYHSWLIPGTWCFLIGSVLFAVKPSLRFAREVHYLVVGDRDDLADNTSD